MTRLKCLAGAFALILCSLLLVEAQTPTVVISDSNDGAIKAASPQIIPVPLIINGSSDQALVTVSNSGATTGGGVGVSGNAPQGAGLQGSGLVGVEGRGGASGTGVSGLVSANGTAVLGQAGNGGTGVRGQATGPDGIGVRGAGSRYGVYGEGIGSGSGIYGQSTNVGVFGISTADGSGVFGVGLIGVRGKASDPTGYAASFEGKTSVNGLLSVTGGCTGCSPPSDRQLKANFSQVNPRFILDRLASIPIQTWNYKSEPETVRHIGAMAQDFRAAFGFGENDTTLNTVDANGVTMIAIQGLYQMMQEKEARNLELAREVENLRARLSQLEHERAAEKR